MEPLTGEMLPEPTGEPVVEGTIVAEFSPEDGPSALPPSGPTVGSLLGYSEMVIELPPGDCGLTVNEGRQKTFEVAAGSPLVALSGELMLSRMSAALLAALAVPHSVVHSLRAYEDAALALVA